MTPITVSHRSTVTETGRLAQIVGAMDIADPSTSTFTATVDMDHDARPWQIGLIIGPSGSGKTSIARQLWPAQIAAAPEWPADRAVADSFPSALPASKVTDLLGRVGLSSVPTWQRPYHVLSNGEKFRADMARLLADDGFVVVDEFTSMVDRTVAKATCNAVGKAIRSQPDRRLVAVTCHYDVTDWLQPDWVVDMASREFTWRSVQPRPRLHLDIYQGDRTDWRTFGPHHYLSAVLPTATARHIFVGDIEGTPAIFCALRNFPHPKLKNVFVISRLVTSPDFQGFGLGIQLAEWTGRRYAEHGCRVRITTSHPALTSSLTKSPRWQRLKKTGTHADRLGSKGGAWRQRRIQTFQYRPPAP